MGNVKNFIIIFFCFCSFFTFGQSELNFYINQEQQWFPNESRAWIDSSENTSFNQFKNNLNLFQTNIPRETSNINGQLWLLIPLKNIPKEKRSYAAITNPHINHVKIWWLNDSLGVIKENNITGDHHAFNSREFLTLNYVFASPVDRESQYLLILIDKRKEILTANIHLGDIRFMERRSTQETMLFGWLVGIVIVLCSVSIVLFIYIKERVYLIYFFFLIFMLLYSFADFGFFHWLFAFDKPRNFDSIRPIMLVLGMVFYVHFVELILETKRHFPTLRKILRGFFFAFIALFGTVILLYFSTSNLKINQTIGYYGIIVSHNFQRLLIVLLLVIIFQSIRRKVNYSTLIGISVTLFLGVHFTNYYYELGLLKDELIFQHSLPFIYTIDCLLMSVIIARKFLNFQKQSLQLSQDLLLQKIEYNKTINEVKEKDLSRISQFLHDSIGAELSAMRYELERYKDGDKDEESLNRIIEKSKNIANEVRNASHNLSPTMLERFGLKQSISQFLGNLSVSCKINFQFEVLGEIDNLPKNINLIIFQIVQEGCQNIIKHSKAQNVIIQLLKIPNKIQIFLEDDGIGFENTPESKGLGIESMRQLTELNSGYFKIESNINKGVKIYAELPDSNN